MWCCCNRSATSTDDNITKSSLSQLQKSIGCTIVVAHGVENPIEKSTQDQFMPSDHLLCRGQRRQRYSQMSAGDVAMKIRSLAVPVQLCSISRCCLWRICFVELFIILHFLSCRLCVIHIPCRHFPWALDAICMGPVWEYELPEEKEITFLEIWAPCGTLMEIWAPCGHAGKVVIFSCCCWSWCNFDFACRETFSGLLLRSIFNCCNTRISCKSVQSKHFPQCIWNETEYDAVQLLFKAVGSFGRYGISFSHLIFIQFYYHLFQLNLAKGNCFSCFYVIVIIFLQQYRVFGRFVFWWVCMSSAFAVTFCWWRLDPLTRSDQLKK